MMKKALLSTAIIALALCTVAPAAFSADNPTKDCKKCPVEQCRPKLYDKNGKELKTPPKPGEKVYDKNGKELKAPPKKMRHEPPKGPELNLTEKQKAQADKIREASKQKIKPIRQEIHEIKNQLWEIRENDNLTEEQKHEKAEPIMKKMHELHQKANAIRQSDMQQFEKILTKEQLKTLENFKKTHKPPRQPKKSMPMPPEREIGD